ncbi:hypothetical protein J4467_01650 [Candidatus Woesearchaeota archaeon]|nr:hypothetical protein [Candidatus Woesearchaeota archaeon]
MATPKYAYYLVQTYVETKVGDNIVQIYFRIVNFIEESGPIIEKVYISLRKLESTLFKFINKRDVGEGIREDLEASREDLKNYNEIYDTVGQRLFSITSTMDVETFLAENRVQDISKEQVAFFISEVRLYWAATYGNHIEKIVKLHHILQELKEKLEEEINFLERLPQESYLEALEMSQRLRNLFYEERNIFLRLVDTSKITRGEVKDFESQLRAQITKVRFQIAVYKDISKRVGSRIYSDIYVDLATARSDLERAILTLGYFLGAANILIKIPGTMIIEQTALFGKKLFDPNLSETGQNLIDQAAGLIVGKVTALPS